MSVWSSFGGIIEVRKDAHISIDDIIQDIFYECKSVVSNNSNKKSAVYLYEVHVSFDLYGDCASEKLKKFISKIKDMDKHANIDLELVARFF